MARMRLGVLAPAAAMLAVVPIAVAKADNFAIIGISASYPVEVEPRDLPGEWKDAAWRRPVWRIAPAGPGELLATRVHKDGSQERFRAVLVRGKDRHDYLDLTPEAAPPSDRPAPHAIYKLEMTRVDGVSIGTPRRVRKEFENHPAKSYHTLILLPPKPSALRELGDDPKGLPGPIREGSGKDVLLVATSAQIAEFLTKHGGSPSLWKSGSDGTTVVKRRPEHDD